MADLPASMISKALSPIVGGVGKELSSWIGDHIRFYRWKNAVRILERAKAYARQRNIEPRRVPLKFLIPFLEGASLEDEVGPYRLTDMWARLLVSAITSFNSQQNLYVDILSKLSSRDAGGLQALHKRFTKDDMFSDDGFDPDSWNLNDIDEVKANLDFLVSEFCLETLSHFSHEGMAISFFQRKWEKKLERVLKNLSHRVDVMPVGFSMNFYYRDEWLNGYSGGFKVGGVDAESVKAWTNLGLFERFEALAVIRAPKDADKRVRLNVGFICLNSVGFGLMKACCGEHDSASKPNERK